LYTPQAAGTAGLIVPLESRQTPSLISFSSVAAAAVGLPADHFHRQPLWVRARNGGIGLIACLSFVLRPGVCRRIAGEPVT